MRRSRFIAGASLVALVLVGSVAATPAVAEEPVWVLGTPAQVGDVTIRFDSAVIPSEEFGLLTDLPLQRIFLANDSDVGKEFRFGVDLKTEGVREQTWAEDALDIFGRDLTVVLAAGEDSTDVESIVYNGVPGLFGGFPEYPGRTISVFEREAGTEDEFVEIFVAPTNPGEFVPVYFDQPQTPEGTVRVGNEISVTGPINPDTERIQLSPGVTTTVTATGLPANRTFDMWLANEIDYFWSTTLGSILLDTSVNLGPVTTAADGSVNTAIEIPLDVEFASFYRLFIGEAENRFFPAGTWRAFEIVAPAATGSFIADELTTEATVPVGATLVDFAFPEGTAGTWTATSSSTGPVVDGFTLAGEPPIYYHLDTSASLDGAEVQVCITYNVANIPEMPRLYHHESLGGGYYRWVDITDPDASAPGRVCGTTTSFSAFALGFPEQTTFDFTGFFAPVNMGEGNLAKAGQAIPVKFSLGGDQGLDVIESARFVPLGTDSTPDGDPLPVTTAGASGLTYDAATDTYTYVWKTNKAWALKTGRFELTLSDGTTHAFDVNFRK
jgi:hypothetical protein